MRVGQQRNLLPFFRQRGQLGRQLLEQRIVDVVRRIAQARRNRRVVDVLRRQAEVHELAVSAESQLVELPLDQILDGLYVVVGRSFDLLDFQSVGSGKVAVQIAQFLESAPIHVGQLRQRQLAKRDEILHLYQHAVADQSQFRKIVGQHLALVAVAPVDRGYGGQFGQFHRSTQLEFSALRRRAARSRMRRASGPANIAKPAEYPQ